MFNALWRLVRAKKDVPAKVTVVGNVFVHGRYGLTRLEAGAKVTIYAREPFRDGVMRVYVVDAEGRRGSCKETEIWEHVPQC